jgi:hypothetical protein
VDESRFQETFTLVPEENVTGMTVGGCFIGDEAWQLFSDAAAARPEPLPRLVLAPSATPATLVRSCPAGLRLSPGP